MRKAGPYLLMSLLLSASLAGCIGRVDGTFVTDGTGGQASTGQGGGSVPHGSGGIGAGGAGAGGRASGQGGAPTTAANGLPCDVQAMLVARCASCHGAVPAAGAPMSLVTYADLMAPSRSNPSMTFAQVSLARMQNATAPMPPAPSARASTTDIATMQGWSAMGFPMGMCGNTTPDGGVAGGAGGARGTGGAGMTDGGTAAGLPCDVQSVLSARCSSCHGAVPAQGAPMSMVSYADLTAPSRSNPSMTVAALSVARMQSTTSPMPPAPATRATSTETATIQAWINAGYPKGTCGSSTDGGTGSDGGDGGVVSDPFKAPPTCTSNKMWTSGNQGSASMNPGMACISCHSSGEGPRFSIAGTVYPSAHEPDRCNGFSGSAQVVIIGADGRTTTLTPNGAGNFYSTATIAKPFQAKVVYQGRERVMVAAQTSGDCNSCHTQSGTMSAPGRILLP